MERFVAMIVTVVIRGFRFALLRGSRGRFIRNPILVEHSIHCCICYSVPGFPLYPKLFRLFPIIDGELVSSHTLQQFQFWLTKFVPLRLRGGEAY